MKSNRDDKPQYLTSFPQYLPYFRVTSEETRQFSSKCCQDVNFAIKAIEDNVLMNNINDIFMLAAIMEVHKNNPEFCQVFVSKHKDIILAKYETADPNLQNIIDAVLETSLATQRQRAKI